jgi:N-acetyl sugar amidotransferase
MELRKNMVKKDIKKMYKLPSDIMFCKNCVISNQRPRITFDEEGVCSPCRFAEHKQNEIKWDEREKELAKLCDKHKSNDGSYDVIVPGSGGKDSNYVAHMLKTKYGMHPLVVTWAPHIYTEIGRKNLTSLIDSGFDNVLITPNGKVHRKLTKAAFIEMGDPFQPFIFGQYSAPFRVAIQYGVTLVFYGEDGEVEYGGSMEHADRASLSYDDFVANRFSSIFPESFKKYGLTEAELSKYGLSEDELKKIKESGIEQHFFSYYHQWIPQENYYYSVKNTNFEANPVRNEGTYSKYASLDDKLDGFHYYLAYIKFGHGRCISDSAHEIRDGHITREEAIALVRKYDGEFPSKYFNEFLEYCDISESDFWRVIDSWRSDNIWKLENGEWILKHPVWLNN